MFYYRASICPTEIYNLDAPSGLFVTIEGRQTIPLVLLLGSSPHRAQPVACPRVKIWQVVV